MLLRIIIENFQRKLGEKILISSIFGIFPSTKMAISRVNFRPRMPIFSMIYRINMKNLPVKFYNNILNGSIFEIFGIPKIGHISESITDRDGR